MITNIDELTQNEAVAYFKADLCLSDPDNYSLDEKREICEQMESTSKAIEDAMKADFESLPPEFRYSAGRLAFSSEFPSSERFHLRISVGCLLSVFSQPHFDGMHHSCPSHLRIGVSWNCLVSLCCQPSAYSRFLAQHCCVWEGSRNEDQEYSHHCSTCHFSAARARRLRLGKQRELFFWSGEIISG